MSNNTNQLTLSWSTSKGQDTYGYNIARLDSYNSGKRYRTCGGGYDMVGTVIGHWLMAEHHEALKALAASLGVTPEKGQRKELTGFYGAWVCQDGRIYLDGACGDSCMWRIAEAIGLKSQRTFNRKGHTTGFIVTLSN